MRGVALIRAKNNSYHYLMFFFNTKCFLNHFNLKISYFSHIIKSNIFFFLNLKYETISLTFGPSVKINLVATIFKQ
jgi:hypothetical protein